MKDLFSFAFQYSRRTRFHKAIKDTAAFTLMNQRRHAQLGIDLNAEQELASKKAASEAAGKTKTIFSTR